MARGKQTQNGVTVQPPAQKITLSQETLDLLVQGHTALVQKREQLVQQIQQVDKAIQQQEGGIQVMQALLAGQTDDVVEQEGQG